MALPDKLIAYLSEEHPGKLHDSLLEHCKELVKVSRDRMASYYTRWDALDMSYRGSRYRDMQDIKAAERKEPEKMVIPLTYSQVETFVAFCMQVYTQRPTFYELEGTGAEDAKAAKIGEWCLEHNLEHNRWRGEKLPQFLRNIGIYGIGVIKHSWSEETHKIDKPIPMPMDATGLGTVMPPMMTQLTDEIVYQGNRYEIVSPYRWFPDPRVPLTRFQEGEFCASEEDYSLFHLKKLEKQKSVAGVKWIPKYQTDLMHDTDRRTSYSNDQLTQVDNQTGKREQNFFIITEVQLELIPSEWILDDGTPLGTSEEHEKYIIWYANDNRIIRIEPMGYLHNQFTYDMSQFNNNSLQFINDGLAGILEQLQDVQNWFINSHITSVRKVISNWLIVDPKGINLKDLEKRKPVLTLRPEVQGSGVDKWAKQLNVQDVTANHVADAGVIDNFAKQATGITENLLGQFSSGRRSALEARNVNNSAAARLLLTAYSIWDMALLPLGRKSITNLRDGMTLPQVVKIIGESNVLNSPDGLQQFLTVDKSKLLGNYDFLVFDGTLASQRGQYAMLYQELFTAIVAKPELAFIFQVDPGELLKESLRLRGVINLDRFALTPDKAQQYLGLAQFARNAAGTLGAQGGGGSPNQGSP